MATEGAKVDLGCLWVLSLLWTPFIQAVLTEALRERRSYEKGGMDDTEVVPPREQADALCELQRVLAVGGDAESQVQGVFGNPAGDLLGPLDGEAIGAR